MGRGDEQSHGSQRLTLPPFLQLGLRHDLGLAIQWPESWYDFMEVRSSCCWQQGSPCQCPGRVTELSVSVMSEGQNMTQ